MVFSDSIFQDCPYTGISIRSYIVFNNGVTIEIFTHVPCPDSQSSSVSDYNMVYNAVIDISYFRMQKN